MKLIEADKVEQAIKDYWRAQVDKLPIPKSIEEHDERVNRLDAILEHNDGLLKAIDELPSAEPCGNVVSRNAIIQKLNTMDRYVSAELRLCDTDKIFPQNEVFIVDDVYEEVAKQLPSVQPTLYGYNIEHLELIARVLQKEGLPPERVVEALTDIGRIVAIVSDEFEETLRKAVEDATNRCG